MKCQICGRKTDWDSSVGLEKFIVCNSCFEKMKSHFHTDDCTTLHLIFACGYCPPRAREIKMEMGIALSR